MRPPGFVWLFCLCVAVAAATAAPPPPPGTSYSCSTLTRRRCFEEPQCVWKPQGTVAGLFQCEHHIPHFPTHFRPRTLKPVPLENPPKSAFQCSKQKISHLSEDACFINAGLDCSCNSPYEASYVIPPPQSTAVALNHSVILHRTRLVFIHVNKAGGTTVKQILSYALAEHHFDGLALGTKAGSSLIDAHFEGDQWPPHTDVILRRRPQNYIEAFYDHCGTHYADLESISSWVFDKGFSISHLLQRSSCPLRLVWGNSALGLCDLFPDQPCVYLTVLRDPFSRALSDYTYFCLQGAEDRHKWTPAMRAAKKCDMAPHTWFQTMLTSPYFLQERFSRGCDPACGAAVARANLAHPCVRVLLLDRLDDGLTRLARELGPLIAGAVRSYLTQSSIQNVHKTTANFTSEQIQALRGLLKEDIAVYDSVVENYERQWSRPLVSCHAWT